MHVAHNTKMGEIKRERTLQRQRQRENREGTQELKLQMRMPESCVYQLHSRLWASGRREICVGMGTLS